MPDQIENVFTPCLSGWMESETGVWVIQWSVGFEWLPCLCLVVECVIRSAVMRGNWWEAGRRDPLFRAHTLARKPTGRFGQLPWQRTSNRPPPSKERRREQERGSYRIVIIMKAMGTSGSDTSPQLLHQEWRRDSGVKKGVEFPYQTQSSWRRDVKAIFIYTKLICICWFILTRILAVCDITVKWRVWMCLRLYPLL